MKKLFVFSTVFSLLMATVNLFAQQHMMMSRPAPAGGAVSHTNNAPTTKTSTVNLSKVAASFAGTANLNSEDFNNFDPQLYKNDKEIRQMIIADWLIAKKQIWLLNTDDGQPVRIKMKGNSIDTLTVPSYWYDSAGLSSTFRMTIKNYKLTALDNALKTARITVIVFFTNIEATQVDRVDELKGSYPNDLDKYNSKLLDCIHDLLPKFGKSTNWYETSIESPGMSTKERISKRENFIRYAEATLAK